MQLVIAKDAVAIIGATDEATAAGAVTGAVVTKIEDRPAREWLEAKVQGLRLNRATGSG